MKGQSETEKDDVRCPVCNWKMTRLESADYYDFDDVLITAPYVRYRCRKCGLKDVDQQGNFVPIPLPPGVVLGPGFFNHYGLPKDNDRPAWHRPYCSKCGLKVKSIPITDIIGEDGRSWHVSCFAGVACFLCGGAGIYSHEVPKGSDKVFLSHLKVPKRIEELWQIDYHEFLNTTDICTGQKIFKFCYSPISHELFFGIRATHHKVQIHAYGELKFADYVRGIYFPEKSVIYLRGHEKQTWLMETFFILRRLGVPKEVPIIWGPVAAESLKDELEGL